MLIIHCNKDHAQIPVSYLHRTCWKVNSVHKFLCIRSKKRF